MTRPRWTGAAVVLAVMLFAAFVRLRLADVPLERDEGEYAYAGRLLLDGVPPYRLAYNMKFPGAYYAYAGIMAVFGETPWGIRVGLLLVNAATTWLVFLAGRRLLGEFAAVVGAAAFALVSLDRWVMGVFGHATHFVVLAAMAGLVVLLLAQETGKRKRFVAAGALLGVSVVMKQHAVLLVLLGMALAFGKGLHPRPDDRRRPMAGALLVAAGAALAFAAVVAVTAAQGVLDRFWFWTFRYAGQYVSQVSFAQAQTLFADGFATVVRATWPLWALAGAGLVALWTMKWEPGRRTFLTGLLVASFLAVCPGFFFRSHYFILLLPAVGLLAAVAIAALERLAGRFASPGTARLLAGGVFVALAAQYVVSERHYLFSMTPVELCRSRYHLNPFVEAPEIARHIRENSGPDERIAVLGSEPEIPFYADRRAATGYLYTYALMEDQPFASEMQKEMIREIEEARPLYVVLVQIEASWLAWQGSDRRIFEWGERYLAERYDLVGIVDKPTPEESHVVWDAAVRTYAPVSGNLVLTFRRKP